MAAHFIERRLGSELWEALRHFRVVLLNGPRQAGKTTLARLVQERVGGTYLTLDEPEVLSIARDDPSGLVTGFPEPLFIDEVQRGGDPLVRAIKVEVDRDPRPGRFVLTGSSRFLSIPTISESLAGRVRIIDLWPLAQQELVGAHGSFVDTLFAGTGPLRGLRPSPLGRPECFELVCRGGFPEAVRLEPGNRRRWHLDYVRTVIARDVEDITRVREAADLNRLVRLCAARTAQVLNVADVARDAGLPHSTVRNHLALLEMAYLVQLVPAWATNLTSKVSKSPKIHAVDTGLATSLLNMSADALSRPGISAAGPLLESFVVAELQRQLGWSETQASVHHFRDRSGIEVDVVLETLDFRVAAVEVKAGRSVTRRDAAALELLAQRLGERFVGGVVLHLGEHVLPLGDRVTSMPVSALWSGE